MTRATKGHGNLQPKGVDRLAHFHSNFRPDKQASLDPA